MDTASVPKTVEEKPATYKPAVCPIKPNLVYLSKINMAAKPISPLPDSDVNSVKNTDTDIYNTTSKPLISHGRPNFTLPRRIEMKVQRSEPQEPQQCEPNHSQGMPNVLNNIKIFSNGESETTPSINHVKTIITFPSKPVDSQNRVVASQKSASDEVLPPPLPIKAAVKMYTQKINDTKKAEQDNKKLLISHGKPNFVVPSSHKSKVIIKPSSGHASKQACENYLEVKIKSLKPQRSVIESTQPEKRVNNQPEPHINHLESAIRSLKSFKSFDDTIESSAFEENEKMQIRNIYDSDSSGLSKTPNWSGRSTPASEMSADSGNSSPPPPISYGKSVGHNHSSYANFEQKTVVSFSKELLDAPNRYPETVKVTKTISSQTISSQTTSVMQQTVFNNLKFVIDNDGQVLNHKF